MEKITILNKKVNLIKAVPSIPEPDVISILIGYTTDYDESFSITKPTKTLTIYGYKYSTADEICSTYKYITSNS